MSPWQACLDALSDHLAQQREALADGRPEDVHAFEPPAGLGPVPPALEVRLRELAAQNDVLTTALAAAGAAVARQVQLVGVLHAPQQASASFVDARG